MRGVVLKEDVGELAVLVLGNSGRFLELIFGEVPVSFNNFPETALLCLCGQKADHTDGMRSWSVVLNFSPDSRAVVIAQREPEIKKMSRTLYAQFVWDCIGY